jgi:SNF2 family DNA or RNA helicase
VSAHKCHCQDACTLPCLHRLYIQVSHDGLPSEEIVQAAGKMRVLDKLLKKLYERGHRVVLFSQYTRTLDMYVPVRLLSVSASHSWF